MAQTKTIQLLRSSQAYASIEAAKTAIQGLAGERKDGEILLGRYWSGTGNNAVIKSVLAVYHAAPDLEGTGITEGTTKGWTFIQDITSSSEGLQALQNEVDAIETALGFNTDGSKGNFTDTDALQIIAANDTIAAAVEKVAKALGALDKTASAVDGKVVTTVAQTNGLVSETQADLTDIKMGGYSKTADTGAIEATDTLEVAVSKLENGIAAATVKSTDKTVKITDNSGKDLSVNIDNTTLVKNETSGVISSALKVIKVIPSGAAGKDEVVDANLSNNVKEAYRLVCDGSTTAIGKQIDIYKDSSLLSVKLLHATSSLKPTYSNRTWTDIDSASQTEANLALCFAYQLADGTTSVEAVAVGDFLRESEFKDGLVVNSTGEVRVLVDQNSESVITKYGATAAQNVTAPVLSVSSDGVKVSNIQNAIDAAVAHASADLAVTAQGDDYINAAQDATDNKKINVSADVQRLTATAGTAGTYDANGAQTAAPTHGTLSGVANSLGDAADIATKVKTYVDGEIAIEAARSDAKNKADLKAAIADLDGSAIATAAVGNVYTVLTGVTETDGVITKTGEVKLAAVAKTGAAADVTIADSDNLITETNVEGALKEIVGNLNAAKVVANDVITVDTTNNTTKLAVTTGDGLEKVSNTLKVKDGNGIIVDANGVSVNAGNGLEIADDKVKIKLDTATAPANNFNVTSDMLSISNDGLMMLGTWDCGVF